VTIHVTAFTDRERGFGSVRGANSIVQSSDPMGIDRPGCRLLVATPRQLRRGFGCQVVVAEESEGPLRLVLALAFIVWAGRALQAAIGVAAPVESSAAARLGRSLHSAGRRPRSCPSYLAQHPRRLGLRSARWQVGEVGLYGAFIGGQASVLEDAGAARAPPSRPDRWILKAALARVVGRSAARGSPLRHEVYASALTARVYTCS